MSLKPTRRHFLTVAAATAAAHWVGTKAPAADVPRPAAKTTSSMKTTILDAKVEFVAQPFLHPLIISSGAITKLTEAVAEVRVRVAGREATGRGSIYLSDLWAWPDPAIAHERRLIPL